MRAVPKTRAHWTKLACEMAGAIQSHLTDHDLKELARAITLCLIGPVELRRNSFHKIDQIMDRVNGVPYETTGAAHVREFVEKERETLAAVMQRTANDPAALLTKEQAAEMLGKCVKTIDDWAKRKYGPVRLRVGGTIRYRVSDIDAFVESCLETMPTKTRLGR